MADSAPATVTAPQLFSVHEAPHGGPEFPLNAAEQARLASMADRGRRGTYAASRQLWRRGALHFTHTHGLSCPDFTRLAPRGAITPRGAAFRSSLSHTNTLILLGFNQGAIGVDAEPLNRRPPWQALARRWFSSPETDWLQAQAQPADAFLTLWTLKEAWIKATSRGMAGHLQALTFDPLRNQLILDQPDPTWCLATTTAHSHRIGVAWQGDATPGWWHDGMSCEAHWYFHEVAAQ
ncbi:4'-phosphopantetheinyl transferase superfamily protein [Salicola sp. Rm-C-2C1-2]|uniref:4'-phosphopantetheinyl transferase family protein n=1 Tax=Salicola sp. Rm-C-2C1-2 TaxID=3141321 RepID=UPI0032E4ED7A